MIGQYTYEIREKYPHFLQEDNTLWSKFIAAFPALFDSVDYDVRISKGIEIPKGTPEALARDMEALSRLRVDVLAYKGEDVTIIEVKPIGDMQAIGQLYTYNDQYIYRNRITRPAEMVMVCYRVKSEDIRHSARRLGIKVVEVKP